MHTHAKDASPAALVQFQGSAQQNRTTHKGAHAEADAGLSCFVLFCAVLCRYDFFLQSPVLAGQMRYECEFDWGGTRVFVSTAIVEGLRCFFIEPRNNFFATPTVYGRYDDEVRCGLQRCSTRCMFVWQRYSSTRTQR
jgi:hypothetical protein